ncbi:MAG: helix-turn-helix domain-containing protein [Litorimonas sp.]
MTILIRLDVMLARRKMKSKDLAAAIEITETNLSRLKSGKIKGIKLETLDRICDVLECSPGDLIDHIPTERSSEKD